MYYSDGLRASKTIRTDTIKYYYNGDNVINETLNGNDYATNVLGVNGYISRQQDGTIGYLFKNVHGDVISAYSSTTNKLADYTYAAWGEHITENETVSFANNPLRYAGQYYDCESGMTYLRARYYDSSIRHFISEDPIRDGLNWYAYCSNNPVMFVDPSGLDAIIITNEYGVASNEYVRFGDAYFGHMAIVVQDENGTWYYFFCGEGYTTMLEVADWAMNSLDNFNYWLSSYPGDYTKATYIKGDFSGSYDYFSEYSKKSENESYNFMTNNCTLVVVDGLRKGVLQSGTSIDEFIGVGFSMIPNIAAIQIEEHFANNSFTYQGSHKQINDLLWEAKYGAWYNRNKDLANRLIKLY